jgi:hypothetical protein
MEQDIIIEVAKRTLHEAKEQVFETPIVAGVLAIMGIVFAPWWVLVLNIIFIFGWIARNEYNDYTQELLMADLQAEPQPDPIAEEVKKQEEQETKE